MEEANGRNLQVEGGMEKEEERQVGLGNEAHSGDRCGIDGLAG